MRASHFPPAQAQSPGRTRAGLCLLWVLSRVGERTRKPGLAGLRGRAGPERKATSCTTSESSPVMLQTAGGETRPPGGGVPPFPQGGSPGSALCQPQVNKGQLPLGPCLLMHHFPPPPHPRNNSQRLWVLARAWGAHHCLDLPSALSLLPPHPAGRGRGSQFRRKVTGPTLGAEGGA